MLVETDTRAVSGHHMLGDIGSLNACLLLQAIPWILDVGYTVMCVAIMLAVMGHILFGDFEITMITIPDSISGEHMPLPGRGQCTAQILNITRS